MATIKTTAGLVFSVKHEENKFPALLVVRFDFIWWFGNSRQLPLTHRIHLLKFILGVRKYDSRIFEFNFLNIPIVVWFCIKMDHIIMCRYFHLWPPMGEIASNGDLFVYLITLHQLFTKIHFLHTNINISIQLDWP